MYKPDISIIIPTLNEAECLPLLLSDLAAQKSVSLEVLITDGGSTDDTCRIANDFFTSGRLTGCCLVGPRGRGRQLNYGVTAAQSDWLLFLHADSRLQDYKQLQIALDFMHSYQRREASYALAGRFRLRFDSPCETNSFGLFYYEVKASLGRPGCIHGDQGMLMPRSFFQQVGPFRQDLPVMEDTTLAESIRVSGQWVLLPGEILTSARRFQIEGFKSRQTLNALMMNFLAIGWLDFFNRAPAIYRQQNLTQPLRLEPFFRLISELLSQMPWRRRWSIWLATGGYVISQAWQIGLALDCRRAYSLDRRQDDIPKDWLNFFDRWFEPLTNHFFGRAVTSLLTRLWFFYSLRIKHTKAEQ